MKDVRNIRPEWVPNAYKDDKSEGRSTDNKAKINSSTLLYSGKKALFKSLLSKTYKKP